MAYWYTYLGSDNIDPPPGYSTTSPKGGNSITIKVTARANSRRHRQLSV